MRYQLEVHLKRLMDTLALDDRAVAGEVGINVSHVGRLRENRWTTIKRQELQALMCWARRHGEDILSIEPSPLWRTLSTAEVVLVRGQDESGNPIATDAQVEAELVRELSAEG